jgi:hypothetical protein
LLTFAGALVCELVMTQKDPNLVLAFAELQNQCTYEHGFPLVVNERGKGAAVDRCLLLAIDTRRGRLTRL